MTKPSPSLPFSHPFDIPSITIFFGVTKQEPHNPEAKVFLPLQFLSIFDRRSPRRPPSARRLAKSRTFLKDQTTCTRLEKSSR